MNIDALLEERPALAALVFDVDGTVAETEDLHRRAFNLAFARHGVELDWDAREYRRLLAIPGGRERIAHALAEREAPRPAGEIAAIHATKSQVYASLLRAEGVAWRPGVARIMEEARRRGLKLALATTTTESNLPPLFEPVMGRGWRAHFEAVVTAEDVARKKPAPDAHLAVLRRMRLPGSRCVALEDSAAGVRAARAAGCVVIATRSAWLPDDDLGEADLRLEHLGDAGRLWDRPHPLLGQRWLSARALLDWHAQLETA